jgi:hypothetical protein
MRRVGVAAGLWAALAGLLAADPPQVSEQAGVTTIKAGPLTAEWRTAEGLVSVQREGQQLSGSGGLFLVTPGKDGLPQVAKLAAGALPADGAGAILVATAAPGKGLDGVAVTAVVLGQGAEGTAIPLAQIGVGEGVFAGFRLASNEFFGPVRGSLSPASLANGFAFLAASADRPAVLCTSASASGAEQLAASAWNADTRTLSGTAQLKEKDRLELRLLAPPEPARWLVESAAVSPEDRQAGVQIETMQTRPWLRVTLESAAARTATWSVTFAQKPAATASANQVTAKAEAVSPRVVRLTYSGTTADLVVRREDGLELPATGGQIEDRAALPGRRTTYTFFPLSWSATAPQALGSAEVTTPELPPLPPLPNVYAGDLKAVTFISGWNGDPRRDLSIEDNPIRIRGEVFAKGIGTHAVSEIAYKVRSDFRRFVAVVGVDDEKDGQGTVTFAVFADDKPLLETGALNGFQERVPINVEIPKGTKLIRLLVGDAGDGVACDHADWANAGFLTEGEPRPEELVEDWLEQGFVPLFNGKDLGGWEGDPRFWSVRDGAIRGETTAEKVAPGNTFLIWRDGTLRDFVLKLKFRIQNGNSGVQYRSKDLGKWRVSGYQAEVENAPGKVGFLYDEAARGWLVNVGDTMTIAEDGSKQVTGKTADKEALITAGYYKDKDWNEYTIIARGRHLVHQLNGYTTMELTDLDAKGFAAEGILALQIHAGPPMVVEFKEIQLRTLGAEFGAPVALFNGKDLEGWTHSSDGVKNTFGVKDGVITDSGQPAGYIRTTADYADYALRVQLRHVTEGNSGVLLRMTGQDKVWPKSIEAQGMFRNLGDIWNIDEFPMKTDAGRTRGRHTPKRHPTNERPLGQWNQYDILLDGGILEIWVNGLLQNAASECQEIAGKICLQSEGAQMEFRNVTLIPIVKTSAAAAALPLKQP